MKVFCGFSVFCLLILHQANAGVIKVDPLVRYQEYYGVGVTNPADYSVLINGYGMGVIR